MRKMQFCGVFIAAIVLSLAATAADKRSNTTLSSLPAAVQAKISATLGQDNPNYFAKAAGSGLEATNPGQKLTMRFTSEGMEVRKGSTRWGLVLRGYGYGNALTTVKAVAPQSHKNQVEYRRGLLTEWYVNGPVGLEQGFTLNQPPAKANGQPLTIALAASGNVSITVDESGTSASLKDRDDNAELRYSGLTATDASGKELRAWLEAQGQRLLLRIDGAKARYPIVVDPWIQLAKLRSGGVVGDWFGCSVAISGDTVAIGAIDAQVGNARLGKAYVFVKPTSGWADMRETAGLTNSDGTPTWLGASVAADEDTVVAGGPLAGAAIWVFVKPASGWANTTETAKLTTSNGDALGWAVSLSGNTVVAGSRDDLGNRPGVAYIFVKPATGWTNMTETAKLTASDTKTGDFGASVAVSGKTVVVEGGGSAYVFVKPSGGWKDMTETAKLRAGGGLDVVSIRGDTVVAGAARATVGSTAQGAAYVFVKPASGWTNMTETARLTAGDGKTGDNFGASVAFGGYRIVVGAPGVDVGSNVDQGAAYLFAKPASGWGSTSHFNAKLKAADGGAGDAFGASVSISNGVVVVGAPYAVLELPNWPEGAVYVSGFLWIRSFGPTSGAVGTPVVITGEYFSRATGVDFGGVKASIFTVDSDTQVTALVPTGAQTGRITITTPAGTAISVSDFTVTP